MGRIGLYIWKCIKHPLMPSWAAATGIFGTSLCGVAVILYGSIHFVENVSASGQAINGIITTLIYIVPTWLIILALWAIFVSPFQLWKTENDARRKAEELVFHPLINIEHSDLFFGPPAEKWMARITPARSATGVQVYLDTSAYKGGTAPNFWCQKGARLILRMDVNFVKGAKVSIDLMELDNKPQRCWRWATAPNCGERPEMSPTYYRCQLVFIAERAPPDHFDFIVSFRDGTPSLIGEHMFLYAREWKSEEAKRAK